jgi:hypothetical protein
MRYFFAKLQIPQEWTGEQAHAVVDLLDVISTAVWDVHELKIIEAMHKQETMLERAAKENDDEMPPDAIYVRSQNPSDSDDDIPF